MFNDFLKVNVKSLSYQLGSINNKEIIDTISLNKDCGIILFNKNSLTSNSIFSLKNHLDYLDYVKSFLKDILISSKESDSIIIVGLPLCYLNEVIDTSLVIQKGVILGGYASKEFKINLFDQEVLISNNNLYVCDKFSFEIIDRSDLYSNYNYKDSNIVLVLDDKETTLDDSISEIIKYSAVRLHKGFIYCGPSKDESSMNGAFINHKLICDCKLTIFENFDDELKGFINLAALKFNNNFKGCRGNIINFQQDLKLEEVSYKKKPYLVDDFYKVIELQKSGLNKRLKAINCKDVVLGFSGGLDSTLALIVLKELSKERELNIHCLILPCFASSNKTMNNAISLCEEMEIPFKIIDISRSVESHLLDIGHDLKTYDVVFENAQARERTQVLFDVANSVNGIVVGTGDLSEIALGFSTFNGDNSSSYNINGGIYKSLIRKVVYDYSMEFNIKSLIDILETPISPELVPSTDKTIVQKTEEIVGPYSFIDFIIYYYFECGNSINDIYYLCKEEFKDLDKLDFYFFNFFKRFFINQFKRSCYSDGLKIFNLSFNPRSDFVLASDLEIINYLKEVINYE